ncbi:MAG TPA: hypothetical protein VJZ27_03555, partial [Aggregatilineales bacterium]|nr:hypothetical protein [Aggregatilineales bacterium]
QRMEGMPPGVLLNAQVESGLVRAVAQTSAKSAVQTLTGAAVVESESYSYTPTVMQTTSAAFRADEELQMEHFGAVTLFVLCESLDDLAVTIPTLHGNLTSTIQAEGSELLAADRIYNLLREISGRLIWNGFPTGVEVVYAQQHGGPYPATTAPGTTSVGMTAIKRFMRPVAYQNMPDVLLPDALKDANPLGIWRIVDNETTKASIG